MDARPEERPESVTEVTRILSALRAGDVRATDELLPVVYRELRDLARARLAKEPPGATLQATALVHEAYLRLVGSDSWESRAHFFGAAAEAMRRILVDRARRNAAVKHGGGKKRLPLDAAATLGGTDDIDLVALDVALEKLERHDERKLRVVLLRYFSGLSIEETARVLSISPATVKTDWSYARAWLHRALEEDA